jgi:hypothetical protein
MWFAHLGASSSEVEEVEVMAGIGVEIFGKLRVELHELRESAR